MANGGTAAATANASGRPGPGGGVVRWAQWSISRLLVGRYRRRVDQAEVAPGMQSQAHSQVVLFTLADHRSICGVDGLLVDAIPCLDGGSELALLVQYDDGLHVVPVGHVGPRSCT
ncbi:MAG TPA: hypothetical protein DCQ04_03590 [Actinobacteria bacterium]|nr:hypothetical protein [Actinomycetota bacterium]